MKREIIQLTYQICAQRMKCWQALGRNYTEVSQSGQVIFHLLDLDTVNMGIRISVTEGNSELHVEFLPSGRYTNDYYYPMDDVPVQPFKNEGRGKSVGRIHRRHADTSAHGEDARGVRLQLLKMIAYLTPEAAHVHPAAGLGVWCGHHAVSIYRRG
jgi:hypothetical protein